MAAGLVLLAVIGFGVYYYASKNNTAGVAPSSNTPPAGNPNPANNPPASAMTAAISIKDFSFNPSSLTIKPGTKVTWTNNDITSHTITSDSGNLLDSPILAPGESFSFTFSAAGTASYHCSIHRMMKGVIIVKN